MAEYAQIFPLLTAVAGALSAGLLGWLVVEKLRSLAEEFSTIDVQHAGIFYLMLPLARRMGRYRPVLELLPVKRYTEWVGNQLHVSGLDSVFRPRDYVGSHAVLCAVGAAIPLVLFFASNPAFALFLSILAGVVFLLIPFYYLHQTIMERKKQIFLSLPYFLDLMTLLVESGMEFTMATQHASKLMERGPLRSEVERFNRRLQLGTPRRRALKELASRCDLSEMNSFVTALLQQHELGSPMADVLRSQSEIIRFRRVQKAEEHANKTPVLILFPMIIFIFPSTFLVLVGPLIIQALQYL